MSELLACLDRLGATELEVASNLKALGIKGTKSSLCQCPIARYLVKLVQQGRLARAGNPRDAKYQFIR